MSHCITVKETCKETGNFFDDGTMKIIVNTKSTEQANAELHSLL